MPLLKYRRWFNLLLASSPVDPAPPEASFALLHRLHHHRKFLKVYFSAAIMINLVFLFAPEAKA